MSNLLILTNPTRHGLPAGPEVARKGPDRVKRRPARVPLNLLRVHARGVLNQADNLKRSLERKKTHDYLNKCCFTDYFESIEHPSEILRNSAVTEFLDLAEEGG